MLTLFFRLSEVVVIITWRIHWDSAVIIHVRVTHRFPAPNKKPLAFWTRGSLVLNGKLGDGPVRASGPAVRVAQSGALPTAPVSPYYHMICGSVAALSLSM